jgi:hypothetical protein
MLRMLVVKNVGLEFQISFRWNCVLRFHRKVSWPDCSPSNPCKLWTQIIVFLVSEAKKQKDFYWPKRHTKKNHLENLFPTNFFVMKNRKLSMRLVASQQRYKLSSMTHSKSLKPKVIENLFLLPRSRQSLFCRLNVKINRIFAFSYIRAKKRVSCWRRIDRKLRGYKYLWDLKRAFSQSCLTKCDESFHADLINIPVKIAFIARHRKWRGKVCEKYGAFACVIVGWFRVWVKEKESSIFAWRLVKGFSISWRFIVWW